MAEKKYFFDSHCHIMNISHFNILRLIERFQKNMLSDFISLLKNPLKSQKFETRDKNKNPIRYLKNFMMILENDPLTILEIMENDLRGNYTKDISKAIITNNKLKMGNLTYDKIILTPLLIDVYSKNGTNEDIYYKNVPYKPIRFFADQISDTIYNYYQNNPEGIFEIYPFLGINPGNYELSELKALLDEYFIDYNSIFSSKNKIISTIVNNKKTYQNLKNKIFSGIKLYPPLNFDPWPVNDPESMEKVRFLYDYCEKMAIPITVHTDDQGMRSITIQKSWELSAPYKWQNILAEYKNLKVNFAHFGYQTHKKSSLNHKNNWTSTIIELIDKYQNVYTDFSFNGISAQYYRELQKIIENLSPVVRDKVMRRIIFGSDFVINLTHIDSYLDYYNIFIQSPFSDDEKNLFCSSNPMKFLFSQSNYFEQLRSSIKKSFNIK